MFQDLDDSKALHAFEGPVRHAISVEFSQPVH